MQSSMVARVVGAIKSDKTAVDKSVILMFEVFRYVVQGHFSHD